MNDFRPVALTSILAKCMEKIVQSRLLTDVSDKLDPLQFAYRAHRGVEDASLVLFNLIAQHLETPKAYARVLFIDFSSAFNTIQTHILLKRLIAFNIRPSLILWIANFLRDRPQRVCVEGGTVSDEIVLNSGTPQGCVLSPTLFSLYTDHMQFKNARTWLLKFADDMALVGMLLKEECLASYFSKVSMLESWCRDSYLQLNASKTKELLFDNRKMCSPLPPVYINNEPVEVVTSFKYLGTFFDSKLSFSENTDYIVKKANQRLFLLRKL